MEKADLIITNAKIFTSNIKQKWADCLAVKGDRFIAVGSGSLEEYRSNTTVIYDAGGRMILPGIIDGHTHVEPVILSKWRIQLPKTDSLEVLLEAAAEYCRQHPVHEVPYFFGESYYPEMFDGDEPSRELLDNYISDRPARLQDFTDHACWFNSMALEYLGITKETPNPIGPFGEIEFIRDQDGNPTGWVKEPESDILEDPIYDRVGWSPPGAVSKNELISLLDYYSSFGIIAFFDAITESEHLLKLLSELEASGNLHSYYEGASILNSYENLDESIGRAKEWQAGYKSRHINIRTVKFFLDGTNELGDCASLVPFSNDPGGTKYGSINMEAEELTKTILRLNAEELDFHIHMVGDRAFRTACDAVESAQRICKKSNTEFVIYITFCHCELVHPDDRSRASKLGIIINWSPQWSGGYFGEAAIDYLGLERWNTMYDFRQMIDAGTVVTYGSDIYSWQEVDRCNPFLGIECGSTRVDPQFPLSESRYPGSVRPPADAVLSIEELILGYTIKGAVPFRLENEMGSIEKGKLAHFVVMNEDIFSIPKNEIHNITVKSVFFEGKPVFGKLL